MIDLFATAPQLTESNSAVPPVNDVEPTLAEHILVEDVAVAKETPSRFRFADRISTARLGPTSAMFGSD